MFFLLKSVNLHIAINLSWETGRFIPECHVCTKADALLFRGSQCRIFLHSLRVRPNQFPTPFRCALSSILIFTCPLFLDYRHSSLEQEELEEELEDSLEDLSDGLDVLMILERAYEKTMKAHVKPSEPSSSSSTPSAAYDGQNVPLEPSELYSTKSATPSKPADLSQSTSSQSSESTTTSSPSLSTPRSKYTSPSPSPLPQHQPTPLREGSATALVAILDHAPAPTPLSNPPNRAHPAPPAASRLASSSSSFFLPRPRAFPHPATAPTHLGLGEDAKVNRDNAGSGEHVRAVIRIAHLGDCMGMLIRGDEIVWRTEEMWWNVSCHFRSLSLFSHL